MIVSSRNRFREPTGAMTPIPFVLGKDAPSASHSAMPANDTAFGRDTRPSQISTALPAFSIFRRIMPITIGPESSFAQLPL